MQAGATEVVIERQIRHNVGFGPYTFIDIHKTLRHAVGEIELYIQPVGVFALRQQCLGGAQRFAAEKARTCAAPTPSPVVRAEHTNQVLRKACVSPE